MNEQIEQSLAIVIDAALKFGGSQVLDHANLVRSRFYAMAQEQEEPDEKGVN